MKVEITNYKGATASCIGIGPAASIAKRCAKLFEEAGFLNAKDVGYSGLGLGMTPGKDDGTITRVDAGSPAAQAGLAVGDTIVAVGGRPVRPTAGAIAAERLFGKRGDAVAIKLKRGGAELDVSVVRAAEEVPPGPKASSFYTIVRPLIDWKGEYVPCIGAGPAMEAAIAYCDGKFKPYGYIKTGEVGGTGIKVDRESAGGATVAAVGTSSAAAKAGVLAGDEIVSIEGKPLTTSLGEAANQHLFGKAGEAKQVTVHRGDGDKTVAMTLAANPKDAKQ